MENLCDTANNGCEGTYDVLYLPTSCTHEIFALTHPTHSKRHLARICIALACALHRSAQALRVIAVVERQVPQTRRQRRMLQLLCEGSAQHQQFDRFPRHMRDTSKVVQVLRVGCVTHMKHMLEHLPPIHPIFDWLVRHAAWVHERFRRSRHDGRSAFARHMLREYPSQVVPFGETVIFRDTGPIKCKLRSNWNCGVWLGRDSQDDMHILGTRQGIVKARCVKRTIPSERYDQQLLLQMKGRPYDIKGDKVFESSPLAQLTPGTSSSSSSAVTTTSRTHCHFVKQARALRVPEVCAHTFVPTHFAA